MPDSRNFGDGLVPVEERRTASQEAEFANNCVATGALAMALYRAMDVVPTLVGVQLNPGATGNQVDVRFDFLASPYRLTVERVR